MNANILLYFLMSFLEIKQGQVNKVFEKSERAIIVEDDLVASPYFLEYCNFGLEQYEMDQRVASLHGFSYEFNKPEKRPQ